MIDPSASVVDPAGPAPGDLELVRQFLNTENTETRTEALSTTDIATAWLREAGLWAAERSLSSAELGQVGGLRRALRSLLAERRPGDMAVSSEATRALRAGLTVGIGPDRMLVLEAVEDGVGHIAARLLALVYDAQVRGDWPRLKSCRQCGWAFFDRSRNRSGVWCSMSVCGSRVKMRRLRAARR